MSAATYLNEKLKNAFKGLDVEKEIHPEDRELIALAFLEAILPNTRAYEHLLEQGYGDDFDYEGPDAELGDVKYTRVS